MDLGNFSVSLNVKNMQKSLDFYKKMGFVESGGDKANNYVVVQNGHTTIGLYQGYIEETTLTFNPKWDKDCQETNGEDIREIKKEYDANQLTIDTDGIENPEGPGYFLMTDPDGNKIMFDQHI